MYLLQQNALTTPITEQIQYFLTKTIKTKLRTSWRLCRFPGCEFNYNRVSRYRYWSIYWKKYKNRGAAIITAFNVVRFRAKPGQEEAILEIHRNSSVNFPGFRRGNLIKTGNRTYCMIGEWDKQSSINATENEMISILDKFRHCLEDLGVYWVLLIPSRVKSYWKWNRDSGVNSN